MIYKRPETTLDASENLDLIFDLIDNGYKKEASSLCKTFSRSEYHAFSRYNYPFLYKSALVTSDHEIELTEKQIEIISIKAPEFFDTAFKLKLTVALYELGVKFMYSLVGNALGTGITSKEKLLKVLKESVNSIALTDVLKVFFMVSKKGLGWQVTLAFTLIDVFRFIVIPQLKKRTDISPELLDNALKAVTLDITSIKDIVKKVFRQFLQKREQEPINATESI